MNETESKNTHVKASKHIFLGWGTSTRTVHYLDSKTNEVKRARHVYFDDHSTATDNKDLTPGAKILRNVAPDTPYFYDSILNFHMKPSSDPFENNGLLEYEVNLAHSTHYPYGIIISYDEYFGLTFVKYIEDTNPWYHLLPPKFRRNIWILSINSTESITAISHYIKENKTIKVVISKWEPTTSTKLDCYRSQFDQVRPTPLHSVSPSDST